MAKRDTITQQHIDETSRIRQRLDDINSIHHRNIRDQLELAMCIMVEFLNEKPRKLEEYIENLRNISNDDVGQALLDNLLEQIRQIKMQLNSAIAVPDGDQTADLDDANEMLSKNYMLLNLINRLQYIDNILRTHIDESATGEN